jgi:hypothetical protein
VQVGDAVGEAGTQVQQGRRGPSRDPGEAVGSAGADPLEQSEHGTDGLRIVHGADDRHLRRARVGEADVDAEPGGHPQQGMRAGHRFRA